jgi:ATP-dependent DNA ligase
MEAKLAKTIPVGPEWEYEPKWDGFRCLAYRDGDEVELQSKSGQPLTRYFPEMVAALQALRVKQFVHDRELIVPVDGKFSFRLPAACKSCLTSTLRTSSSSTSSSMTRVPRC